MPIKTHIQTSAKMEIRTGIAAETAELLDLVKSLEFRPSTEFEQIFLREIDLVGDGRFTIKAVVENRLGDCRRLRAAGAGGAVAIF